MADQILGVSIRLHGGGAIDPADVARLTREWGAELEDLAGERAEYTNPEAGEDGQGTEDGAKGLGAAVATAVAVKLAETYVPQLVEFLRRRLRELLPSAATEEQSKQEPSTVEVEVALLGRGSVKVRFEETEAAEDQIVALAGKLKRLLEQDGGGEPKPGNG